MGANLNRRFITIGLIGASLAAAAPAGAMVADKNLDVQQQNASTSTSQPTGTPRMTPPNVDRALRTDAQPSQSPAPDSSKPRMTPPNVERTLIADNQPVQSPSPDTRVVATGFQWSDAAIGAAGMLTLLAAAGGLLLVGQRRRHRSIPITG